MARPTAKNLPLWRRALWWAGQIVLAIAILFAAMVVAYRWLPVGVTPLMLWRTVQGYGWQQQWVPIDSLPNYIGYAAIASEDNNFCSHGGVDWQAISKVLDEWSRGGRLRGASTIPMQTAKNVFLWPGQDVVRKALEVPLTYIIELAWGKKRILEIYLNVAEWGPGIYGIEAAARHHYGKSAKRLTRLQAAYLVAVLPAPLRWSPSDMPIPILLRAESISTRVRQLGPTLNCVR